MRSLKSAPHTARWSVVKALQGEHMIRYTEEHVLPRLRMAIEEVAIEDHQRSKVAKEESDLELRPPLKTVPQTQALSLPL